MADALVFSCWSHCSTCWSRILDRQTLPAPALLKSFFGALLLMSTGLLMLWMAIQPQFAPPGAMGADKILHLVSFAALAVVAVVSFSHRWSRLLWLALLAGLGLAIEVAQSMVTGRQGSVSDLIADLAGLVLGTVAIVLLRHWMQRRRPIL